MSVLHPAPKRIPLDLHEICFAIMPPEYLCDIDCIFELDGHVDFERLKQAFLAAIAEEPMWGYRYVEHWWTPHWEQFPREERAKLISCVTTEQPAETLGALLRSPVEFAVTVTVFRSTTCDRICFRFDHRLVDATGSRLFTELVAEHYQKSSLEPEVDAPLKRRTFNLLKGAATPAERRKLLWKLLQHSQRVRKAPVLFELPPCTAEDPLSFPWLLHYPAGSVTELSARALRDRASLTMALQAATFLAARDLMQLPDGAEVFHQLLVDLRRYLPASEQKAHASMLIGMVLLWYDQPGLNSMSAVLSHLRTRLTEQRGPQFALMMSPVPTDVPLLRFWSRYAPYLRKRKVLRKDVFGKTTPKVAVTDLGNYGQPGDAWAPGTLKNAFCTTGPWGIPSVTVGNSSCGNRLNISVSTGPNSFCRTLAERINEHLSDYAKWTHRPAPRRLDLPETWTSGDGSGQF